MIYKDNLVFFFKNDLSPDTLELYNRMPIIEFMKILKPSYCIHKGLKEDDMTKIKKSLNDDDYYAIFIDGENKILKILNNGKIEKYGDKIK